MTYIDFMPIPGKKSKKKYTESISDARNNSRARNALHDMVAFNQILENEMQAMLGDSARGTPVDKDLLAKMVAVKEKYLIVMQGLQMYDDQQEHLALVVYADAVQDVINHLNKQKRH